MSHRILVNQIATFDHTWHGSIYKKGDIYRSFTYIVQTDSELTSKLHRIRAAFNFVDGGTECFVDGKQMFHSTIRS